MNVAADHTENGQVRADGAGQLRPGEMSADELDELGARIPFGDKANQTVPPTWASAMLRLLREREPALFVALMGEASAGIHTETAAAPRRHRATGGAAG